MAPVHLSPVIVDDADDEHETEIRHLDVGRAAHECAGLGDRARDLAGAAATPLEHRAEQAQPAAHRQPERVAGHGCAKRMHVVDVVLQIRADAGKIVDDLDAVLAQVALGSDTGKLQQVRRVERAAADDHFAVRPDSTRLPVPAIAHADGAPPLEQEPFRPGSRDHGEIPAAEVRREIGPRRAAALAVDLGHLVRRGPALLRAVEIRGARDPQSARKPR